MATTDYVISFAPATILIIVLSVGISLYAFFIDSRLYEKLTLYPYKLFNNHNYHQLLTSGLLHGDLQHLFVNNAVFLIFGTSLELLIGSQIFLLSAAVVIILINIATALPHRKDKSFFSLGLGGLIIWNIICVLILSPSRQLTIAYTPWVVPSILFALGYFIYIYYVIARRRDDVHHWNILAGVALAIIFIIIYMPSIFKEYLERITGL